MAQLKLEVLSSTRPGVAYTITRARNQAHWYCSCPAWRFQKVTPTQRTCKHLRRLARELAGSARV